jgi:hypothetical protein
MERYVGVAVLLERQRFRPAAAGAEGFRAGFIPGKSPKAPRTGRPASQGICLGKICWQSHPTVRTKPGPLRV